MRTKVVPRTENLDRTPAAGRNTQYTYQIGKRRSNQTSNLIPVTAKPTIEKRERERERERERRHYQKKKKT